MIKDRISRLSTTLSENEAVIISSYANRLYYTGFSSSAGTVIVTVNGAYMLIDFRYYENAVAVVDSCEVILQQKLYEQIKKILSDNRVKTVYLETGSVSIEQLRNYREKLTDFTISDDNKISELILKQRSIKSQDEIAFIKQAQKLTDDTFDYILSRIKSGMTEKEIMLDMEFFIRRSGSEGVSFDFIVVSGENSSLPHGVPTDRQIRNGDFITMDFGAVVGGYHSDMTRTVAVGSVSEKQRLIYDTVLNAQKKALDIMKPGVRCCDVDKIARDEISNAGFGNCFGHGFGHSVGIEIHESPACNTSCVTVLEKGMVMTAEPGIYLQNEFGVRIEDMVVITDDGCENLTKSTKELIIL